MFKKVNYSNKIKIWIVDNYLINLILFHMANNTDRSTNRLNKYFDNEAVSHRSRPGDDTISKYLSGEISMHDGPDAMSNLAIDIEDMTAKIKEYQDAVDMAAKTLKEKTLGITHEEESSEEAAIDEGEKIENGACPLMKSTKTSELALSLKRSE